jgi:hypothetical protein
LAVHCGSGLSRRVESQNTQKSAKGEQGSFFAMHRLARFLKNPCRRESRVHRSRAMKTVD